MAASETNALSLVFFIENMELAAALWLVLVALIGETGYRYHIESCMKSCGYWVPCKETMGKPHNGQMNEILGFRFITVDLYFELFV